MPSWPAKWYEIREYKTRRDCYVDDDYGMVEDKMDLKKLMLEDLAIREAKSS